MFRVLFSKIKIVGHVRPVSCELSSLRFCSTDKNSQNPQIPCIDQDPTIDLPLPEYQYKENEPLDTQKARLVYQSRKRGMLENDILLSTFAAKFLPKMTAGQVDQYDKLINRVSNDWDIYYWATETKPMPEEYNNEIMQMLKKHVKNELRETRYRQPDLH